MSHYLKYYIFGTPLFLQRMNNELCRAYGLSVIENPKKIQVPKGNDGGEVRHHPQEAATAVHRPGTAEVQYL